MNSEETILVLDFGAQYAHLIARRIRELGVRSILVPHNIPAEEARRDGVKGLVLSGGPASVYSKDAPHCDSEILDAGVPILGICYGLQLIVHLRGGRVAGAPAREYGKTRLKILDDSDLFKGLAKEVQVWMSHGDRAETLPEGFEAIGASENAPYASVRDAVRKVYAVQFHPEVIHTPEGESILRNFVYGICGCRGRWRMEPFIDRTIAEIRNTVGEGRVICAVSGGIDSTVTAILVHRAVGERLTAVFVDHGLLRKGERNGVVSLLKDRFGLNVEVVDASDRFLARLKGVGDPEEKRRIVGEEFVRVFADVGTRQGGFEWLAQGTLYPDVIESSRAGSPASRIKTHHNVGGLPDWMEFRLIEPLRELYKDEVRKVAGLLGLPDELVKRHPFPGPGLAVRITGEVTEEKLRICRESSHIVEEELRRAGLYERVWQAFAVVGDDRAVGVQGDERRYGRIVTIRVVESSDAMTADWFRMPYEVLERISNRITNEVPGVTWVSYAVSSKPPSTIEPQ